MKRKLIFFTTLLMTFQLICVAQDITTTISSPKITADIIYPLKATASLQFTVSLKNNETLNTYTVSIDKAGMLPLDSWVGIDNNSRSLGPGKTENFILTLTIPAGQGDGNYNLPINSFATLNNNTQSVMGKTLTVIVDNAQPSLSEVNVAYSTSTTVRVTYDGFDARSAFYTTVSSSSGYNGVKNFNLILKNSGGTIVANPTVDATTNPRAYTFSSLVPNSTYNASVVATDLAGNSATSQSKSFKTQPGAPTNFIASSSSYCRLTLSWDNMSGATGYQIGFQSQPPNTTTVNTYTFTGLEPNTPYTFDLIAVGESGSSDKVTKTFRTPAVTAPRFIGSLSLCGTGGTVQVRPIADAVSYNWTITSPMTVNGAQSCITSENSVNVQGSGSATITVSANTSCGISSGIASGEVKIGSPVISSNYPLILYGYGYNNVCNLQNYTTSMNIWNAESVTWTRIAANPTTSSWYQSGNDLVLYFFNVGQTAAFEVTAINSCGTASSQFGFQSINCGGGGGGGCDIAYSAYPNPASQSTKITPNIPAPCDPVIKSQTINGKIGVYSKDGTLKKSTSYKSYNEKDIDVSDLEDGLYYINVFDGTTTTSIPLVVKH